jgi:hypothetical protein
MWSSERGSRRKEGKKETNGRRGDMQEGREARGEGEGRRCRMRNG